METYPTMDGVLWPISCSHKLTISDEASKIPKVSKVRMLGNSESQNQVTCGFAVNGHITVKRYPKFTYPRP